MDTIITIDGFEYVLENGMYVNKNDDAYYDSTLEWIDAKDHDGMRGICKVIGSHYLVKYVFTEDMDGSLFRDKLDSLLREHGNGYIGLLAEADEPNYIGGLFNEI